MDRFKLWPHMTFEAVVIALSVDIGGLLAEV